MAITPIKSKIAYIGVQVPDGLSVVLIQLNTKQHNTTQENKKRGIHNEQLRLCESTYERKFG